MLIHPDELPFRRKIKKAWMLLPVGLVWFFVIYWVLNNPPTLLTAMLGQTENVKIQVVSDSLKNTKLQLHRYQLQIENLKQQLQVCKKQDNTIIAVGGDGVGLHIQKPQFQSWTDWAKAHPGKKFSDFREAENLYLKDQIEKVWEQIRKGNSDE